MRRIPILTFLLIITFLLSGCCSFFPPGITGPQPAETEATNLSGGDYVTPVLPPDGALPTEETEAPPSAPEPTEAAPSNWPIAYAKDNQIWIYYPDTGEKRALTGPGSPSGLEGSFSYPKVSPSGTFVAFNKQYGEFIVLNLEDHSFARIPNGDTQMWATENILGWDAHDNLYVTQQVGICVFWEEPNSNISAVNILVYDPRAGTVVDSFPLPQNLSVTGNSTGIGVTPDGRFITGDPFYCGPENAGIPDFVYDRQTGAVYWQKGGDTRISADERWLAELDDSKLNEQGAGEIHIKVLGEEDARLTYTGATSGTLLWELHWSPNSEYLAALEFPSAERWAGPWIPNYKGGNKLIVLPANGISESAPGQAQARVLVENVIDIFSWTPDSQYLVVTTGTVGADGYYQNITLKLINLQTLEQTVIDSGQIFNYMY